MNECFIIWCVYYFTKSLIWNSDCRIAYIYRKLSQINICDAWLYAMYYVTKFCTKCSLNMSCILYLLLSEILRHVYLSKALPNKYTCSWLVDYKTKLLKTQSYFFHFIASWIPRFNEHLLNGWQPKLIRISTWL